jgi:hypothetical protein
MASAEPKLYLLLISVHGLIRGHDLELGRDADTGGQTLYVVELARALGECEAVERVDLVGWIRSQPRAPDIVHNHYADAGYVGVPLLPKGLGADRGQPVFRSHRPRLEPGTHPQRPRRAAGPGTAGPGPAKPVQDFLVLRPVKSAATCRNHLAAAPAGVERKHAGVVRAAPRRDPGTRAEGAEAALRLDIPLDQVLVGGGARAA